MKLIRFMNNKKTLWCVRSFYCALKDKIF